MLKFCRDFYPLQKSWLIEPRFLCASKKGDSRWAPQSTRCCWSKPTNFFTVMWWVLHYSSGQKFELLGNPCPLTASILLMHLFIDCMGCVSCFQLHWYFCCDPELLLYINVTVTWAEWEFKDWHAVWKSTFFCAKKVLVATPNGDQ